MNGLIPATKVGTLESEPVRGLRGGGWLLPTVVFAAVVMSSWLGPLVALLLGTAAALATMVDRWSLRIQLDRNFRQRASLDDQLIQTQKLASLGEMASGIAHEINTPLAVIGQEAELLQLLMNRPVQDISAIREELVDSIGQISDQVDRCGDITHKLLGIARQNKAIIQATDLQPLVEDMVRLVEREARFDGIIFQRSYDPAVPAVTTDPALLRQVLLNLLNNAVQAIDKDGEVEVSTTVEKGWVSIGIRDTGCGIPQENLDRIFLPFFTTKPPGKGTGLGLPICLTIMNKLGGSITVSSKMGKGSVFRIRLPLRVTGSA